MILYTAPVWAYVTDWFDQLILPQVQLTDMGWKLGS